MTQPLDLDALQAAAEAAKKKKDFARISPYVLEYIIDRLRKAEAASVPLGHVIVPAKQFLAVLYRNDWRTAKNRSELRAMLAAPDSTPTDSADSEGAKG
jgi:hypothetical protein